MCSAKETDRRIRELAAREGRNGMTIRFVDPATLRPAQPEKKTKTKPSSLTGSGFQVTRIPDDVRTPMNERRRKIIEFLDRLEPGDTVSSAVIATAINEPPAMLVRLLGDLTRHGIIHAGGYTTKRRYWR